MIYKLSSSYLQNVALDRFNSVYNFEQNTTVLVSWAWYSYPMRQIVHGSIRSAADQHIYIKWAGYKLVFGFKTEGK